MKHASIPDVPEPHVVRRLPGTAKPPKQIGPVSAAAVTVPLVSGLMFYRRVERVIADV
jgi:hypothetical protein